MKYLLFCSLLATCPLLAAEPAAYDPLKVVEGAIAAKTFDVQDAKSEGAVPIRVYLPKTDQPAPVILFSHGLGGSRDNNPYLGNHWAARGYVVVFVQHPGSDESVWKDQPPGQRMAAMKKAASLTNFLQRTRNIPAVINTLTTWNAEKEHPLKGRLDLEHLGMSGHSFGAVTTQAVAGQSYADGRTSFAEPRIDAAVMMSPSAPELGEPAKAFAAIKIPCLLLTGTEDTSPIGKSSAADRLKVFPNLRHAPAWQVVFDKATHMSFGERELLGQPIKEPRYHRAILALTTAFWDMTLKGDPAAQAWLNGPGAKSVLVPEDQWQWNGK